MTLEKEFKSKQIAVVQLGPGEGAIMRVRSLNTEGVKVFDTWYHSQWVVLINDDGLSFTVICPSVLYGDFTCGCIVHRATGVHMSISECTTFKVDHFVPMSEDVVHKVAACKMLL